ncbi:MAG TPA: 2-oxoglutarate and iron-dependent oxygenase domain-containing protein [Kiloniellales bacterium]|nr:2-oxoglutarate and iron-dependent oxygenase domain-containing protein [Kiloniellales bacterium]
MQAAQETAAELRHLDPSLVAERVALDAIPLIDFGPFRSGSEAARKAVALQLGEACRNIGFFYVVNHGVPDASVAAALDYAKRFFALPVEDKREIAIEKSACHRGWFQLGGENLDPAKQREAGDLKEGLKIGRDLSPEHPLVRSGLPLHGPNQWPSMPGFKGAMQDCYGALSALGRQIMRGFALALEMPETFFDKWLTGPMATLGPLHYPPHTGPISETRLGAGAHTDFGCLTILWQDAAGGLLVKNTAGKWIDALPVAGSFVVNIGDMMARWTNDLFTSTYHRVINVSGRDRYSMPFFFDPDFNADLTALPTCVGPERPARYPPTTGGQHLIDRINETFAYHREKKSA